MRRRFGRSLAVAPAFLASPALPAAPPVIFGSEADKHVRETIAVSGLVADVHVSKSDTTFVNFGRPYPNQTLTAVILRSARARFPTATKWKGKVITVIRWITLYRAKPEVILETPEQVDER